jgi:hypothetical protein
MGADTPLNKLVLSAASVADDVGYAALADLAHALGEVTADYRIIGGHMVTMLAARWQLGAELYRETDDVDLGVPPIVARDHNIVDRLKDLGYAQVAGNRFTRRLSDVPLKLAGGDNSPPDAFIDVLVPAYTSRARQNVAIAEHLFTTEVPGLSIALASAPVILALEMHRLNGKVRQAELPFPDEVSALVLKSLATRARVKDTDIADIWRCLEIAFAAGRGPADFADGIRADSAAVIRKLFDGRHGPAMRALATEQHLSGRAADERFTRVRALIRRVLGPA